METFHVFSAGAAQAVVAPLLRRLELEDHLRVQARYGAVQAMRACVVAGEPADVVLLTDQLMAGLVEQGLVVDASCRKLGAVGTGLAVPAGSALPDVTTAASLRASLLAAGRIFCPDPATATAGKVLLQVLEQLGISAQLLPRLVYAPSGYEAMAQLAELGQGGQSGYVADIGVMQMSEIIASKVVSLAGPLPGELQKTTVYTAGVVTHAQSPGRANDFVKALVADPQRLLAAGFGPCEADAAANRSWQGASALSY